MGFQFLGGKLHNVRLLKCSIEDGLFWITWCGQDHFGADTNFYNHPKFQLSSNQGINFDISDIRDAVGLA